MLEPREMADKSKLILTEEMWLDLDEAGTLCKVSRRAMAKRISTVDFPKEKIRKVPGTKSEKWQVHLSALPQAAQQAWWDARNAESVKTLTGGELDRQTEGPITRYAHAEQRARERAAKKARWTREFTECKTKREQSLYAAIHHLSLRTLYHWARKAKLSGAEPSPSIYIGKHEIRRGPLPKWPKEMIHLAVNTYLQGGMPTASRVAAIVREECGKQAWPVPGRATVARWLQDDKLVPPAVEMMARGGERAYRDFSEPVRTRDWSQIPINGCWIGDHHELDLMVITPDRRIVRPWLTSWLDARSRLQIGYHLCETPSSDTIALALRHGILAKEEEGHVGEGVPECVLCDNGRDYKSHFLNGEVTSAFKQTDDLPVWGLFAELGIKRRWTRTYSARSKASKERSYGLIEQHYIKGLPGYCGNSPKARPETLAQDIALTKKFLATNGAEGEKKLFHWWEFEDVFNRIILAYNHHAHGGIGGKTPAEVWQALRPLKVPMPQPETLDILMLRPASRMVHNYGIRITFTQAPKEACTFHDRALFGMAGQTVHVRYNPYDRTSIQVIKNGKFICHAKRVDTLPPFAETEEEKAELAGWIEATVEQRKAFRAYLDSIRQPSLFDYLGLRKASTPKARHSHRRTRLDGAAAEAKAATYEQTMAVAAINSGVSNLYEWKWQKKRAEEEARRRGKAGLPALPAEGPEPEPQPSA